jgi:hypothetical protein
MRARIGTDRRVARATAALAGVAALLIGVRARAAVPVCIPTDLSGCCYKMPNPVFIAGTSAAKSALQAIAKQLTDISIIYQTPDSCIALTDVVGVQAATGANVVTTSLAPDGTTPACALTGDPANPDEAVNIAVSDIFPATCQSVLGSGGITAGQQIDVLGPIQGQTIDVPSASKATSISAEAAYVVFGYGADMPSHSVAPWNVPANIFIRPSTSGTLNLIGKVIDLAGAKWANATNAASPQVQTSSANIYTAISTAATNIDATIGILSAQFVLQQNAKALVGDGGTGKTIKTLAFQATGQSCGYFPDSTENKGDKMNVRQGRYAIWGPAHLVTNIGADGNPKGAHAAAVTAVLNAFIATGCEGASCPPGSNKLLGLAGMSSADAGMSSADGGTSSVDGGATPPSAALKKALIDAESAPAGGVVPWCAMQVTRGNIEAGAEASYQPSEPCGCYFEKVATGAPVSHCLACPNGNECVAPSVCRYGYCEVK